MRKGKGWPKIELRSPLGIEASKQFFFASASEYRCPNHLFYPLPLNAIFQFHSAAPRYATSVRARIVHRLIELAQEKGNEVKHIEAILLGYGPVQGRLMRSRISHSSHKTRRKEFDSVLHVLVCFRLAGGYLQHTVLPSPYVHHQSLTVLRVGSLFTNQFVVNFACLKHRVEVVPLNE